MDDIIKILYIDDSPLDRDLVRDSLEREHGGFMLTEVASREDFVQRLSEHTYDLVLTDFNIRGLDGLQVLDLVRSTSPELPVIIITGTGSEEVAVEALKRGVDDYVIKTKDHIRRLPRTIFSVLEKKRLQRQQEEAVQSLQFTNERLNLALEAGDLGLWDWNVNTNEVHYDDRWAAMLGYSMDEIEPYLSAWERLVHPDDKDQVLESVQEHFKGLSTRFKAEQRLKTKSGEWKWVLAEGRVVERNQDGTAARILGIHQDITELIKAQEALAQSKEELRLTLNATTEGIWKWNFQTQEMEFSSRYYAMLGYEPDEFSPTYENWLDLIHPDDRSSVLKVAETYLKTKPDFYENEFRLRTKSGDYRWIHSRAQVVEREPDGKAVRMIGNHEDITERKRVEEALRKSEDKYRTIVETANEGIWGIDAESRTTYVNERMAEMLGYSIEEMIGASLFDFMEEKERLEAERLFERRKQGVSERHEFVFRRKDGTSLWAIVSTTAQMDDRGNFLGAFAMITDITDRKEAERRITRQQDQMKFAQDMARIGYWTFDIATGMPTWSDMMFEVLGCDPTKGVPHYEAHRDFIYPEDWDAFDTAVQGAIQGIPYLLDLRIVFPDGSIHYVTAEGHPQTDEEGVIRSLFGVTQDITDRMAAEVNLKQSRQAFTNIVEMSTDAILVVELNGKILYANGSATQLLGYEHDNLKETPFGASATIEEVATINMIRSDGEIRDVEMRTAPTDWFGQSARVVMLRDITERERHEAALLQEKEKTEQYLNVAGVMFVVLDRNGNVVAVNRKTCEVLRREIDELVGCDWFSTALPLEDRNEVRRIFDHLMEVRLDPYEYVEAPVLTSRGETRLISWHNSLLKDDKGEVSGTVSSGEDITEQKEMETRLAESEERYRLLFEQSSEAIFIARPEGEILTANDATAVLFGVKPEDLTSLNIKDFYRNPDDRIAFRREVESKGFVKDYPLQMKQKDGTEKLCVLSSSLWKDREGAIIGYLSMLLDVTDHRRLEEQLRQAQKMESIGTLAGGVAHDFNNILTIIQGYSEMVIADKSEDHPDYADLSAVNSAAQRGADLVKQLMTFSRKVETEKRPVNLNTEVQTAVKLLSRTIPKMIDIRLELAPDIGRINADPGQMEQVIMNLAVNAKHAMADGGTLTIETGNITLDEEYFRTHAEAVPGDYAYLIIEDTGHGMSKDIVDRIFEPFFSTKNQGEGTGLGLAMVYGIVKNHGGHIKCYSEPGVGTTFKIYLPVIEDVATSGEFKIQTEAPGGSETILLVDDEEMIRNLGRKMLERAGYKVVEAETGEQAVETYRTSGQEIDLVVLDIIMPGMGGHRALAELKKIDSDVRVIVASGYSPDGHAKSAREEGGSGFVAKPFRRTEVLRAVREVLDR